MHKNPNSWKLIAMFFVMALMFAMQSVQGNATDSERDAVVELMNYPPGQTVNVIMIQSPAIIIESQKLSCTQIERGVSVPYLGLTRDVLIYIDELKLQPVEKYFAISNRDYVIALRQKTINDERVFTLNASDLGNRQRSGIYI